MTLFAARPIGRTLIGLLLSAALACTTDQPKKIDAGAIDAGPVAPADAGLAAPVDAGAAVPDGGVVAVVGPPLVSEQVDAGHMGDAKVNVVDGHAPVAPVAADNLQVKIFNRLLVKVATKDMPAQQLQALVEEATGQKLEKVRKTAGTFWLLQFAPVVPVRNRAAQEALIAKLKATNAFVIVEGDQVVTLKAP